MALIKAFKTINQSTSPNRMKRRFFLLCILSTFSIVLYSSVIFEWIVFNEIREEGLISISYSSNTLPANLPSNATNHLLITEGPVFSLVQNRRFAIFSCSIHSTISAYTFYTPITAASWKRIGYEVIVFFAGDFSKPNVLTARLNLSRNYLKRLGARIIDIQCDESYSNKSSQLVRVFSGFLSADIVQDEDVILTGDSDLIPLNASNYQPTPGTQGFIYNAFCCESFRRRGRNYTMFPMGHIFLQKKAWRAMVMESKQRAELLVNADNRTGHLLSENAVPSFEMLALYGRHEFNEVFDQVMNKSDAAWFMDQHLCSMMLTDYQEKHPEFTLSKRDLPKRLDRDKKIDFWDRNEFSEFGDAHLIHDEILEEKNWKIFNKLLKFLFNETLVALFNDYHQQYMIADATPRRR